MSMKGDLPGLSNFCPGAIGSCQYRTFLPCVPLAAGAGAAIFMPALMPTV
jgi:hypothetical protein